MKIDIYPRNAGKTRRILEAFEDRPKDHLIITHSEQEAQRLRDILAARNVDFLDSQIMSVYDIDNKLVGKPRSMHILVDNVDLVMEALLGRKVEYGTATRELFVHVHEPLRDTAQVWFGV